jgi:ankyrin repeat protein
MATGDIDRTPLSFAAANGLLAVVRLLLEKNAETDSKAHSRTPLSYAAKNGWDVIVWLPLGKGTEIDSEATRENVVVSTPLSFAARQES